MPDSVSEPAVVQARSWLLSGHVQGVGFRPFVYRLAIGLGLRGYVKNIGGRVEVHGEGNPEALDAFARRVIEQAPAIARPRLDGEQAVAVAGHASFTIAASGHEARPRIQVPPDYFTCPDCQAELADPTDRRHRYPFINCTQCGPRYTLIRALPYDRPNTTMAGFPLCAACSTEYSDPADRRFHAEPLACPVCGPSLSYCEGGRRIEGDAEALAASVSALRAGRVVAVKGIGGYHLMCDATSDEAVALLRTRKSRPDKPLAVLFPSHADDPLQLLQRYLQPDGAAATLLIGPGRPIVLCAVRGHSGLSALIAPGLNEVGAMLPYSPLHQLLLDDFGGPLVATSGNISGEPVITDNEMAETRLAAVADAFLHHDRPIERPADDSVYRVIGGRPAPIRLGRGAAPLELDLPLRLPQPVLAVGCHMKNTVALAWDDRLVVSPHIGEMESRRSLQVFEQVIADLQRLYGIQAEQVLCDAHPGYAASRWARDSGLPVTALFHHHAHASALALDHRLADELLVFAWDGVGYGADGILWGGEAFLGAPARWRRYAAMRPFRLPGGDKAGREPWRSAAALCWELGEPYGEGLDLLHAAWQQEINAPTTTAMGRLFDAAAALTGVCRQASFEGQGPMLFEAQAVGSGKALALPLRELSGSESYPTPTPEWECDWAPLIPLLRDEAVPPAQRAADFHESLAQLIRTLADRARGEHGIRQVGLSGGVFQNRRLVERAEALLTNAGFEVLLPRSVPVNDGGLSAGQVMEYAYRAL